MMLVWLGAAFWAALGAFITWQSYAMGLGSLEEPGTGMLSFGLGLAIIVLALGRLVAGLRNHRPADPAGGAPLLFSKRVAAVSVVLIAYFAAFERVGFVLSTVVLMLILFIGFGGMRKPVAAVASVVLTGATYGVFKYLLGTQLPAGWLG